MPKLRKQRRKKVYRYNINRKRLRNRIESVGTIKCREIKKEWDRHKSVAINMQEMGLSYDPNQTLKIPKTKVRLGLQTGDSEDEEIDAVPAPKSHIVDDMEAEAKAPRVKALKLPKGQVETLIYFLDKYGEDYHGMVRDPKNYYQHTWKQFRAKIKLFKSIPDQYNQYLANK